MSVRRTLVAPRAFKGARFTARGERTPLLCPATDERGRSASDAFPFPHVAWGLRRSRNVQSSRALDPIARNPPDDEHVACIPYCQLRSPCSTFRLEDAPTHSAVCTAAHRQARPRHVRSCTLGREGLQRRSGPAPRGARPPRSRWRSLEHASERGRRLPLSRTASCAASWQRGSERRVAGPRQGKRARRRVLRDRAYNTVGVKSEHR